MSFHYIVALFAILPKHGNEPITFSNADTFLVALLSWPQKRPAPGVPGQSK
jgi:hypothetical protein